MRRETVCYYLDLEPAFFDRLVKSGLLPPPVVIQQAKRWQWKAVEDAMEQLSGTGESFGSAHGDIIMERINGTAKKADRCST
ncbi:MAG: hypothetical protein AAFY06_00120 [Pseudomonadota bacterium]